MAQLVRNPPAMQETWVRSLGCEDPLEKGTATYSSILAWRMCMCVYIYMYAHIHVYMSYLVTERHNILLATYISGEDVLNFRNISTFWL